MFHSPGGQKGCNDNDQGHYTHYLQEAKPEFPGNRLRDVFALIFHYAKIHYFRLRVKC
jgi:hypothetical protein